MVLCIDRYHRFNRHLICVSDGSKEPNINMGRNSSPGLANGNYDVVRNGHFHAERFVAHRYKLAPSSSSQTGSSFWRSSRAKHVFVLAFFVLVAAAAGFAVGFLSRLESKRTKTPEPSTTLPQSTEYQQRFKELVSPKEMEQNLRFFTSRPHVSGSQASRDLTDVFVRKWREYGFEVEVPEYEVLMSYPLDSKPNTVIMIDRTTGRAEHTIVGKLNITSGPDSNITYPYLPYLAFATNGTVQGELVYANKGYKHDFLELQRRNISVKGRIVIMRTLFGSISEAEAHGAAGVILYPDPIEYAPEGHSINDTYPNTPWLPPDGVQRLSLIPGAGDSLTPLFPAADGIHRKPNAKVTKIPAQTISYRDAQVLLSKMSGDKVPDKWKGGLHIDYRFGAATNSSSSYTVKLEVHNSLVKKKVRNVIATIKGSYEPDRYILIGNHRDGWSFGAADPSSGSATLAEVSRVLSVLLKEGWKPKRTIKLCSWGAEEFGLFGSIEWVEDYDRTLKQRAVAYINTDVAVGGNFVLFVQMSPMLSDLIISNTKKIPDPVDHERTLYDTMLKRLPPSKYYPEEPHLTRFHFSTDNLPFCLLTGLPTVDFSFFFGYKNKFSLYPVYHSQYDNFDWIKRFADPQFTHFNAMAQLLGGILLDLTDTPILPFSIKKFGRSAKFAFDSLQKSNSTFERYEISLDYIKLAIDEFLNATEDFESAMSEFRDQRDSLVLRMLNDQIAQLEKVFVSPYVMSDWEANQKILVNDKFANIEMAAKSSLKSGNGDEIKKQVSIALHALWSATRLLKPFV